MSSRFEQYSSIPVGDEKAGAMKLMGYLLDKRDLRNELYKAYKGVQDNISLYKLKDGRYMITFKDKPDYKLYPVDERLGKTAYILMVEVLILADDNIANRFSKSISDVCSIFLLKE